jgi:hypothetical protein
VAPGNEWRAGVDTLIIRERRWSGGYDEEWLSRVGMTDVVNLTKRDAWDTAHSPTTQISVNAKYPVGRDHIPAHEVNVFLSHDVVPLMRDSAEILRVANPERTPEQLPF